MGLSDIKKNLTSEPTVRKSPKVERAGVYCMEAEKAAADADFCEYCGTKVK